MATTIGDGDRFIETPAVTANEDSEWLDGGHWDHREGAGLTLSVVGTWDTATAVIVASSDLGVTEYPVEQSGAQLSFTSNSARTVPAGKRYKMTVSSVGASTSLKLQLNPNQ